jgi:hypothetical protein
MAAPHPGRWKPVFVIQSIGDPPYTVLNTGQTATHACLICTHLGNQEWKILYGYPTQREGNNNQVQTRIWDPVANNILQQDIPDWPSGSDRPALFCGGHTFLADGKILWAGGMRLGSEPDVPHYPSGGDIF